MEVQKDGQKEDYVKKPLLSRIVRGWPFPNTPGFPLESITNVMDYRPLDDDVILCSFPRSGSTWTQYLVWSILHKAETYPKLEDLGNYLAPFVDKVGIDVLKTLPKPRFYKTHIPGHLLTTNSKAKYIYIYRHPRDVVTSYYHFLKDVGNISLHFDEFFERFLEGNLPFGDFFDHVLSFCSYGHDSNLLFLCYEDMKNDLKGQILRLAKFLGQKYFQDLAEDDTLVEEIIRVTSFDHMKKNLSLSLPSEDGNKKKVAFFRKGTTGDGKESLSTQQEKKLREKVMQKMDGTEFVDKWI